MRIKIYSLLAFLVLFSSIAFAALTENDTKKAYTFIETIYTDITSKILNQKIDRAKRYGLVKDILITNMDIKKISTFILGSHWKTADNLQKEAFMTLFTEFQTQRFTNTLGDYNGQKITLLGTEKSSGDQVFVNMKVMDEKDTKAEPIEFKWRVNKGKNGFKVVDVVIGGISMSLTLKNDYDALIKKATENGHNGLDVLLEELEKKIELEKNGGDKK